MRAYAIIAILIGLTFPALAPAEDWPTYGHDNRRSHVTGESLPLPLVEAWVYRSPHPPQTAWTGPAKWDAYASNEGLQSMRNFDPAFFVTAVGDQVFFGSSADNAAHCLDAKTGTERWVAFAGSAVRLPPSWHEGKVYFGADDGYAYCVDAASGEEQWRFRPLEDTRMIPSNGKLISRWPVRTGVMIDRDSGTAYFAGSLFPWQKSYLCAVDAASGRKVFVEEQNGVTLQGALLASADRLFAPQGRSVPLVYAMTTGSPLGNIAGAGGVFCILTEEEQLISMPSSQKSKDDVVQVADTRDPQDKSQSLLSIAGADRMLVAGRFAYFHQRGQIKAIDRFAAIAAQREINTRNATIKDLGKKVATLKKAGTISAAGVATLEKQIATLKSEIPPWQTKRDAAELWRSPTEAIPSALILAGEQLLVGGNGVVSSVSAKSGDIQWSAQVEGRVYGLAAANGRLYASTDRGHIVCFTVAP